MGPPLGRKREEKGLTTKHSSIFKFRCSKCIHAQNVLEEEYYKNFDCCLYHDQKKKQEKPRHKAYISDFWFHYKKRELTCRQIDQCQNVWKNHQPFNGPFSTASK